MGPIQTLFAAISRSICFTLVQRAICLGLSHGFIEISSVMGDSDAGCGDVTKRLDQPRACLRLLGKLTRGPTMRCVNLKVGGTMKYVTLPNTA